MKPNLCCCMENVGPAGEIADHLDGRILNPGHAIEAAWFLMEEGRIRARPDYVRAGCDILDWMWARGWDPVYGGMLYFVDVHGKPVAEYWHDMKFWWPQNEAIIATLMAYHLTGDEKYAHGWHQMIHDWTYARFPDPEYGEWPRTNTVRDFGTGGTVPQQDPARRPRGISGHTGVPLSFRPAPTTDGVPKTLNAM